MIATPIEAPRALRSPVIAPPPGEHALSIVARDPEHPRRAPLIGRERELALLTALVDHAPETGAALLIRGGAGAGKSALVGAIIAALSDRPVAVLRASGIRAEANLPYAGLHQLLRPVLGELGSLPRPQRRAIEAAFGIAGSTAPDPFLIAIATLDLLSMAARPSLVVVAEDAQWLDRPTSEVLSFVARRLSHDRIVLLVTARDDRRSPILDAGLSELHLQGLGAEDAGRLLAAVTPDIAASVRDRLIGVAAGNPLALVELPMGLTREQLTGDEPLVDPIPFTARLERAVAGRKRERVGQRSRHTPLAATTLVDELEAEAVLVSPDVDEAEQLGDPRRARLQLLRESSIAGSADVVATDIVRLAEAALDDGDDDLARRLLWTAAQEAIWGTGEHDGASAVRGAAARMGSPGHDPMLLAISAAVGSTDAASISDAAATFERPDAAPTDLLLLGMASAIAGDVVRSRSLLVRSASVLGDDGDRRLLAPLFCVQALNDIQMGRWTEAAAEIEAAAEHARGTGQAMWSVVADVAGALLAALRGDEDQVDRALARVGPAAIGRGNGWVSSTVDIVRAVDDLSAGRPELAFTRLYERITSSALEVAWAIDHFADAAVLSGRVDEGRAVLAASDRQVELRRGPMHVAAHAYAGAVLADDAVADERQTLALEDLVDWPVHQARLQLHRGRWLRRHRRVADSRLPLRAARDLFEAFGAEPLTERARRELRASGERIRQRDVTAWDQLSPQESEIARMAAEGLSNREIGEQLFLSHRTVGAHLYRIFPKLGVTSRGQLHRVLATTGPDRVVAAS